MAWATRASVHFFSEHRRAEVRQPGSQRGVSPGLSAALLPRGDLSSPPNPNHLRGAGRHVFRHVDEMLLERVRHQPILAMKLNNRGIDAFVPGRVRRWLACGLQAGADRFAGLFRARKVAAYRLNRLLGLNAVPPAAPRNGEPRGDLLAPPSGQSCGPAAYSGPTTVFNPLGKTAGVVMYWVPEIKDSNLDTPEGIHQSMQWVDPTGSPFRSTSARCSPAFAARGFRLSHIQPRPLQRREHEDISRRLTLAFHGQHHVPFSSSLRATSTHARTLHRTQRFSRQLCQALDRVTVPRAGANPGPGRAQTSTRF